MSSIWLVMSDFAPIDGEGFHLTEEAARERLAQLGGAGSYSVTEVPDATQEIHPGGSVPDTVWVLLEGGSIEQGWGFWGTQAGAREALDARDVAGYDYWECSTDRELGMRLADYLRDRWPSYDTVCLEMAHPAPQSN